MPMEKMEPCTRPRSSFMPVRLGARRFPLRAVVLPLFVLLAGFGALRCTSSRSSGSDDLKPAGPAPTVTVASLTDGVAALSQGTDATAQGEAMTILAGILYPDALLESFLTRYVSRAASFVASASTDRVATTLVSVRSAYLDVAAALGSSLEPLDVALDWANQQLSELGQGPYTNAEAWLVLAAIPLDDPVSGPNALAPDTRLHPFQALAFSHWLFEVYASDPVILTRDPSPVTVRGATLDQCQGDADKAAAVQRAIARLHQRLILAELGLDIAGQISRLAPSYLASGEVLRIGNRAGHVVAEVTRVLSEASGADGTLNMEAVEAGVIAALQSGFDAEIRPPLEPTTLLVQDAIRASQVSRRIEEIRKDYAGALNTLVDYRAACSEQWEACNSVTECKQTTGSLSYTSPPDLESYLVGEGNGFVFLPTCNPKGHANLPDGSVCTDGTSAGTCQKGRCSPSGACDPKSGQACTFGDGACAGQGIVQCDGTCVGTPTAGSLETCDGLDNDCDGYVDEGCIAGCGSAAGIPCAVGTGGCARVGTLQCDGSCNGAPGQPSAEVCDGLDNDCDGQIDEEANCAVDDCVQRTLEFSGSLAGGTTDTYAYEICHEGDLTINWQKADFNPQQSCVSAPGMSPVCSNNTLGSFSGRASVGAGQVTMENQDCPAGDYKVTVKGYVRNKSEPTNEGPGCDPTCIQQTLQFSGSLDGKKTDTYAYEVCRPGDLAINWQKADFNPQQSCVSAPGMSPACSNNTLGSVSGTASVGAGQVQMESQGCSATGDYMVTVAGYVRNKSGPATTGEGCGDPTCVQQTLEFSGSLEGKRTHTYGYEVCREGDLTVNWQKADFNPQQSCVSAPGMNRACSNNTLRSFTGTASAGAGKVTMENQDCPDAGDYKVTLAGFVRKKSGPTASGSGCDPNCRNGNCQDEIDPGQVTWLHKSPRDYPITATLGDIGISGLTISWNWTHPRWPVLYGNGVVGNMWVFANIGGRWYGATWEWLRSDTNRSTLEAGRGQPPFLQTKTNPIDRWYPRSGEVIGFMASTPVRTGVPSGSPQERSPIVKSRWP